MAAYSYWQGASARRPFASGAPPSSADVVVIGGGLLGSCCAYWLARRGRSVLLLERDGVAAGATGRNAGFVVPTTARAYSEVVRQHGPAVARAVRRLAVDGTRMLTRVVVDEGVAADLRSTDLIELALDGEQVRLAKREVELSVADGFPMSWLDRDDLAHVIGTPLDDRIAGGTTVSGALANSVAVTDGIIGAAGRLGAAVHTGVTVNAVRATPSGVRVDTNHGVVHAAQAVIAVNAWSGELVPRLADVIRPVQGQVIATPAMPALFPAGMAAPISDSGVYWQQDPDGSVILGGCRTVTAPPADPTGQVPQPEVHEALLRVLPSLFPALGPVRSAHSWAGAMAFTADGLPVAERVDESVWAVGGFNGHGMPFGAIVADLVAEWVCTGVRGTRLAPFALDRATLGGSFA
ncbi:FAD-dependent oxidoreductase [Virgisporangium aliadipatigenens]|uniref:FAD-dependent oxidoreductase n=1 Tax=Virgisporangium aliadipatigenens TaxID=741659 RepID=A0A8J4DVT8_9ACTN|nr:FAD-dependent oxidoreductase [Virgisporangium aliadipatigenens]GIJ51791.1 FAD-dependent oxidoreductase [Virgisporangium aliadipatigenens]